MDTGMEVPASQVVLQKVAEREGVPMEELTETLFDVVDPDALDTIFRGSTGHLTFEFHGYVVTVNHTGAVSLASKEPAW